MKNVFKASEQKSGNLKKKFYVMSNSRYWVVIVTNNNQKTVLIYNIHLFSVNNLFFQLKIILRISSGKKQCYRTDLKNKHFTH